MPGAGTRAGIVKTLMSWLAGWRKAGLGHGAAPRSDEAATRVSIGKQPFAPRREVKPVVPAALGLEAQLALGRSRALSARLRSVAAENVPSALAGRKATLNGPAGKAIPKLMPRVLKRYRKAGQAPLISARSRILKLTTLRPSNVIDLVTSLKAFRASWMAPRSKAA